MPTKFAMYVKDNYHKVATLPAKERMKALGVMYRGGAAPKGKAKAAHGGGILSDVLGSVGLGLDTQQGGILSAAGLPMKKRGRKAKAAHGGGFLSDALGSIGLGLPASAGLRKLGASSSARAPRNMGGYVPPSVPVDKLYSAGTAPFPSMSSTTRQVMGARLQSQGQSYQGKGMVATPHMSTDMGGGLLSSALGMFGLGLPVHKTRKPRAKKAKGGILSAAGLPVKKRGRKAKKDEGAGLLSGALGMFGL